jgi:hypothetical protein
MLKPSQSFKVVAYIDARFTMHNDGKSHTEIIKFVGGVAVYCASRKQKCVSKSPTEAELVALSDNIGFVELFQEFLSFVTNSNIEMPLIYQDNTFVISLVTLGGGIKRTKYMRSGVFLVMESLKAKRAKIRYVHTSGMIADGLTKPIDGRDFDYFGHQDLGGCRKVNRWALNEMRFMTR